LAAACAGSRRKLACFENFAYRLPDVLNVQHHFAARAAALGFPVRLRCHVQRHDLNRRQR
jgi:hypothetical protein